MSSPIQAIRKFCRICNGETEGGKFYDCLDHDCYLYPFKEGKGVYEHTQFVTNEHLKWLNDNGIKPKRSRTLSPEVKQAHVERMKKYWEEKRKQKE